MDQPHVVETDKIPLEAIDPDAVKVIGRLRRHGHEAYLVGGCVRDLLSGLRPKDFDVITSARPRQVRRLFANSRVIGRRFRLVHVIFGDNVIEVSTFRANPDKEESEDEEGVDVDVEVELDADADTAEESDDVEELEDDDDDGEDEELEDEDDEEEDLDEDDDEELEDDDDDDDEELEDDDDDDEELEDEDDEEEDLDEDDDEDADDADVEESAEDDEASDDEAAEDADEAAEDDDERPSARRRQAAPPVDEFELNNVFGTPEEDARRRDFTINALFYDPEERHIIDYVGGLRDLERRLVNPIRDPEVAFVEDPVRMIRAVRFAAKLEFTIADHALAAIERHRALVEECSQRRLLEEIWKILKGGHAEACIDLMIETQLLEVFLPELAEWLAAPTVAPPLSPSNGAGQPPAEAAAGADSAAGEPADAQASVESEAAAQEAGEQEPAPEETGEQVEVRATAAAPPPAEPSGDGQSARAGEAGGAPQQPEPTDPAESWGEPVQVSGDPPLVVYPEDPWEPDDRMIDAFLRVTWERPHPEGANDWVEDPQVYLEDTLFEAAAFARDRYLERVGLQRLAEGRSERERAVAVLRMLRWNGRLDEMVASFPPEPPLRRRRRRRKGGAQPEPSQLAPVLPPGFDRRQLLKGHLANLDKLSHTGVPLSNAVRLAVLFGPLLLEHLDSGGASGRSAEELADEVLYPIARRHSLARKDRDRIKRCTIILHRLLSGDLTARSRGRDRLVARDYFREAIVLMWLHCRVTDSHWDEFRYWEGRAKAVKAAPEPEPKRRGGGRRRGRGRSRGRSRRR